MSTTDKPKMGRPTKYKESYCEKIVEYFSEEPYREVEIVTISKKGDRTITHELRANDLPFISGFARSINVTTSTVWTWGEKHENFSNALKKAKDLQKEHLVTNGLQGLFQVAFAIFTAKNITEFRDTPLIDQSEHKHFTVVVKTDDNSASIEQTNRIQSTLEGEDGI